MIRLTIPSIDEEDLRAVRDALASGFLVQGKRVADFERSVAEYVGTKYAIAVSNCTAALHLALLAVGVGPGDRVAVPAFSWPATANVVVLCGAEPVFIEIDPDTWNMSPSALEQALSHAPVKVVMPVHVFGGMADMLRLSEIAARYGALTIEDAACALGGEVENRRAGTWGAMGCFSFHPRKAITTGEGGMITTDDSALARMVRMLRNHGQDPDASQPDFILPGYNLRLTEFQAALGLAQMKKVERIIESRRRQAANYEGLLAGTMIEPARALEGSRHVYQSYVALLPKSVSPRRSDIIESLKSEGIETTIGTYHLPLTTHFRTRGGYAAGDFAVTDEVAARAISVPMFETLTIQEQKKVVDKLVQLANATEPSLVARS